MPYEEIQEETSYEETSEFSTPRSNEKAKPGVGVSQLDSFGNNSSSSYDINQYNSRSSHASKLSFNKDLTSSNKSGSQKDDDDSELMHTTTSPMPIVPK